ncbi:hypothetical protein BDY21DRAFT_338194 [Lineolata rhizophorae]|uniref:Uncharacterized protein n=1 Tax=Lineolata rhizophorae TaxID=578093 RepID=A0A6A6P5Y8_9PEZI|nr:hypothetical protein BDY21DRAFT_338194 [Lineolata rhizophorae]
MDHSQRPRPRNALGLRPRSQSPSCGSQNQASDRRSGPQMRGSGPRIPSSAEEEEKQGLTTGFATHYRVFRDGWPIVPVSAALWWCSFNEQDRSPFCHQLLPDHLPRARASRRKISVLLRIRPRHLRAPPLHLMSLLRSCKMMYVLFDVHAKLIGP